MSRAARQLVKIELELAVRDFISAVIIRAININASGRERVLIERNALGVGTVWSERNSSFTRAMAAAMAKGAFQKHGVR